MKRDYFFAVGKPDAVALIFISSVQTLKNIKNRLKMFGRDSDAVVFDREMPFRIFLFAADFDFRAAVFFLKFDGIGD